MKQTARKSGAVRTALACGIGLGLLPAAQAFEFSHGELTGSLDTTLTYGASVRMQDVDDNLLGKAQFDPTLPVQIAALTAAGRFLEAQALQVAARGRFSVNGDDGNPKYDKHDLVSNAFKIGSELGLNYGDSGAFMRAVYFYDFENASRSDLTRAARDRVGKRFRLLDAFAFTNFALGESASGTARLGRQVVSWGESTFLQNGINVINAVDVSALRVAGAELKEAFLPLDSLWMSASLTENLSVEGVWMFEFEEIEVDAAGTYFSNSDFATPGGTYAMLGFGTSPQPVNNPELYADVCFNGAAGFARSDTGLSPALVGIGCASALPRLPTDYASDSGQWGVAARYYATELNETEFGFFYVRYHSRLPLLSLYGVTNSNANSAAVVVEYPEDIDLYGLSWNTTVPGGWALQGEISHRDGIPLQIDAVEVIFAALSPLNVLIPQPALRFNSQLGQYGPGDYVQGWERHEVSQLQATMTKIIGPGNWVGAEQVAVVVEAGGTKVWDLPAKDVLRYAGEGTTTGGGADIDSGALRNPLTQEGGFPDAFSWGYRAVVRADYNNVFGTAINVSPRVAFNHDVHGTTPGPGGNFVDGRKSLTLGAEAQYLNQWVFDLSYTAFTGGGEFNTLADRDFASFVVKYSF